MVKESNLETTPGLIALIDNPTEEDLLRVIYSDKVESDIIKELPDSSITSKVATIALCLNKTWRYQELVVWFDKFIPHINSKDYLKVFITIEDNLPILYSKSFYDKDYDLFIELFSKINNPDKELIDFYLKTCIKNNVVTIERRQYRPLDAGYVWNTYSLNIKFITNNLKGILNESQKKLLVSYIGCDTTITGNLWEIDPDLDELVEDNNKELNRLSHFISKESCDKISHLLDGLNKPSFKKKKQLLEDAKEDDTKEATPKEDTEISLWERFLRVFK